MIFIKKLYCKILGGDKFANFVMVEIFNRYDKKDYPDLVERIIPYYKVDPSIGYDILSFEIDGTEKHIEVKSSSTNSSDKKIHFFISDNEDEHIVNNPNACIYYVYNFKNKKIKEIKREQYLKMKKTPRLFEVDIDCE